MYKTGVVILNYNDAVLTGKLIRELEGYEAVHSICVVDNCSVDNSAEILLPFESAKCHVIINTKNLGYAAGNNIGCRYLAEHGAADLIYIANPDIMAEESAFEALAEGFEKYPEYAVLTPVMYNADGSLSARPFLRIPSFLQDVLLCFYTYNRIFERKYPYRIDTEKEVMQIDAAPGCFWAIRTSVLQAIDYMDEGTFLYYEEFCTAERLRQRDPSQKIGLLTKARYTHDHSVTIRKNIAERNIFKIYMKSKMYFELTYRKIGPAKKLLLAAAENIAVFEKAVSLLLASALRKR